MSQVPPTQDEVRARALEVLSSNLAFQLATTGGPYSPWVLGAYYFHEGTELWTLLETSGKSLANLRLHRRVSFVVSRNDPMQDFLQGIGEAEILDEGAVPGAVARMTLKMPSFKLYTPTLPVRIRVDELFVSSLKSGWLPARRWRAPR